MILVAITMLLTAAMVLNHAVHGIFFWGFHPGGSLSATIYDLQILVALIGLLRLTVSLLRRTVPCEWIQLIAIGAFGLASAATYMLFGWQAHTSAHWQGPENLIAFQTVACTTYLIGRYGGTPKPHRRWLQFSLRRLLVVMLLTCGVFGLAAQFSLLNVVGLVLLGAIVCGVAMSRRNARMLGGEGVVDRMRRRLTEYERRGGWFRPFINGVFFLSIALASVIGALWYDGLHDVGEYGGVFQFVAASLISYLLLCVAVICLTVTLLNFSKLPRTQRILGTLPIVLTGAVFLLMAILR
jgi:hypothetical protein